VEVEWDQSEEVGQELECGTSRIRVGPELEQTRVGTRVELECD
jgi:hypothetical protein